MLYKLDQLKARLAGNLRSLTDKRPGQLPALDGLRTLAVTLVIAGYCKNDLVHAGAKSSPAWFFDALFYGWSGVDLFFVLSGFLIGRILFSEVQKTGTVKVGEFLLKRGLRIWPLYYFVCALVLTKMSLLHQLPAVSVFLPDLLFLNNFFHREILVFGSWSLSVEEQFYLLASVLILCCRGLVRSQAGKITHFLAFLFCCVPFARAAVWNSYASRGMDLNFLEWEVVHAYIFTHCDGLLVGLFFASLVVFRPRLSGPNSIVTPLLASATVLSGVLAWMDPVLFKYTFVSLLFGLMVWHCVTRPQSALARFFSWPHFQVISRLSYGMYIWYRFPLWRIASSTRALLPEASPMVQWAVVFVVAFTIAAALATLTYVLVERPFLLLRDQYFSRKSRARPVLAGPRPAPSASRVVAATPERIRHDHLDYT